MEEMKKEKAIKTADTAAKVIGAAEKGKTLCIDTELGQLVAYPSTDPSYPGIYIDLKREGHGCMAPIAMVECVSDDNGSHGEILPPSIVCRVWGDVMMEDYTHRVTCKNLDKYFASSCSGMGITDRLGEGKKLCVDTELGQLTAYLGGNPDYPGIYIDVKRGSMEAPAILVEYTTTEESPSGTFPPSIICRMWGNAMNDDYTDAVACQNLDKYFEEDK